MHRLKKGISYYIKSSQAERNDIFHILIHAMIVYLLVKVIPPKFYFNHFFVNRDQVVHDLQLFNGRLRLINKTLRLLPWRITCLMESMIVFLFFRREGIYIAIHLGVKVESNLCAHAWYSDIDSNGFYPNII